MQMMSPIVAFICFIMVAAINLVLFCESIEYGRFAVAEKRSEGREEVKACGSMLADILSQTCSGHYNPENTKRAGDKSENTIPDLDYYYMYETYPEVIGAYPFRSKRSVSSILRSSPLKRKHGLVDECCKKSCTLDEIRSYCG